MVYYGSHPDTFACAPCSAVFHVRGPKWYLINNLTQSPAWEQLSARGYEYIMIPGGFGLVCSFLAWTGLDWSGLGSSAALGRHVGDVQKGGEMMKFSGRLPRARKLQVNASCCNTSSG